VKNSFTSYPDATAAVVRTPTGSNLSTVPEKLLLKVFQTFSLDINYSHKYIYFFIYASMLFM